MAPKLKFGFRNAERALQGGVDGWRKVTKLDEEIARLRAANKRLRAKLKAMREAKR